MKASYSVVFAVLASSWLVSGCKEKGSISSGTGRSVFSYNCSGDLYVHPKGDNSAEGTVPEAPLKTIQQAVNLSRNGQTVCLGLGVYSEESFPLQINKSIKILGGSASVVENILTAPEAGVFIIGAGGDPWGAGISATIRVLVPGVTIQGLQFSVPPEQEGTLGAIALAIESGTSDSPTRINNNVISGVSFNGGAGGGVAVLNSDVHVILTANAISHCHDGVMVAPLGITGGSLKLRKNLIMNNNDNALYLAGSDMTIDLGTADSLGENVFFNDETHLIEYESKSIYACPDQGFLTVSAVGNTFALPDSNRSYESISSDGGIVSNGSSRPSTGPYLNADVLVGGVSCNGTAQVILSE